MDKQCLVAITGATGFVGRATLLQLRALGWATRALVRNAKSRGVFIGDIGVKPCLLSVFDGVDVVVHTAARVHVMKEQVVDSLREFRRVNVEGTLHLAREAAQQGVRRFVYISSVKVNGEMTAPGQPFRVSDLPAPAEPYGISKMEAETELKQLSQNTGMEVVIIRPPLVYGPGVGANFMNMMSWLQKGVPLPFGAIRNKRSLVALDNLVSLIVTCIEHPDAANKTFLVSDGHDLSTTELMNKIITIFDCSSRLVPVPQKFLEFTLRACGKGDLSRRLCGSLQVDIRETKTVLDWRPPESVDDALQKTVEYFIRMQLNSR